MEVHLIKEQQNLTHQQPIVNTVYAQTVMHSFDFDKTLLKMTYEPIGIRIVYSKTRLKGTCI